jgi:cytochrome c
MDGILMRDSSACSAAGHARAAVFGLATLAAVPVLHADDASAGAAVFASECSVCHSVVRGKNKIGPSLFGVIGRPAGSIADFDYSASMKSSGIVWGPDTLQRYIADPAGTVQGVRMTYAGLKDDAKRSALIVYLSTAH